MCGHFGMPTPDWAVPDKRKTVLSEIRNKAIHEALYSGEPFGFALHGDSQRNMTVEMEALVCRLIVALIGASSAEYIKTPVNTRQYQSLDL